MRTARFDAPVIAIIAGEASGDFLGAGLIEACRIRFPQARFVGVAGPKMRAASCEAWFSAEALSVMGLVEILTALPRLLRLRRSLYQRLITLQPDIVIGIDAPDFTLPLEVKLKKKGLRVVHYVSPSVWAWRKNRLLTLGRATDRVLALFPFEKPLYDAYQIPCCFVGHPLADQIPQDVDRIGMRNHWEVSKETTLVALLPGSRYGEIKRLTPEFLAAIELLYCSYPKLRVMVPLVSLLHKPWFDAICNKAKVSFPIRVVIGSAQAIMMAADVTLLASGTATLEGLLVQSPMVIGYKVHPLTYWIAKRFIQVPYIGLPNLLSGKVLVPECVQKECTPERLAEALKAQLTMTESEKTALKKEFFAIHRALQCGANERAAEVIAEIIEGKPE